MDELKADLQQVGKYLLALAGEVTGTRGEVKRLEEDVRRLEEGVKRMGMRFETNRVLSEGAG